MVFKILLSIIAAAQLEAAAGLHLQADDIAEEPQCAVLTNVEGTHFTIAVDVGTPPQRFDLVADTGSPWVIIEDCRCKTAGYCDPMNKCFKSKDSKSFEPALNSSGAYGATLYFGSGPIEIEISDDKVALHGTTVDHYLDNGVLLMVDHMLNFGGQFEGILGLGMPKEIDTIPDTPEELKYNESTYRDGFVTRAGFNRFTVCIEDDGNWSGDGALHLGGAPSKDEAFEITSNTYHWQLPLNGASVGESGAAVAMCSKANMTAGQESPCAAIFDSGTTYILGPQDQVDALFDQVCDGWPRCKKLHTEMLAMEQKIQDLAKDWKIQDTTTDIVDVHVQTRKAVLFQVLMNNCSDWYDEKVGVSELPTVSFTVSSHTSEGKALTLDLPPQTYIVSQEDYEVHQVTQHIPGIGEVPSGFEKTSKKIWTCTPAFGAMEMPTEVNGPGWILGTPLFYAYTVNYDMTTKIPTISFSDRVCDKCGGKNSGESRKFRNAVRQNKLRKVTGVPHMPKNARRLSL